MFSKACTGAFKACLFLVEHHASEQKWSAKAIANALSLPEPFMAKLLQQLARFKFISSTKGPNGGFYMTEDNLNTPPIQIIEKFDGLYVFEKCILDLPECSSENPCPLHPYYSQLKQGLLENMSHGSIADFAKQGGLIG